MTSKYILIVDDDPAIREGLTHEVEREFQNKAIVLNCKNGAIASELLRCNTIDIVVTDIKMPVMNGIELLQFIKDNNINCKSLVLSSYDDFNLVRDAMRLNASDYLLKPVDFPTLHRTLYKLLTQVILEHNHPSSSSSPFNMWQLLENYLQNPSAKSVEMMAFEEKYTLTETSPCIAGCIKLQTTSAEKAFELQKTFREELYSCLNMKHIQYRTIITGEVASCFVFLIFPETEYSYCLDILASYKDTLAQNGIIMRTNDNYYTLKNIPLAFQECLTWFDQCYYDLPYSDDWENCTEKEQKDALGKAIHALNSYDIKMTLHHLTHFFVITNILKPSVKETRKILTNMMYELIKFNPKFIEPLSRSKFTDYDIFQQIEESPSLSLLQKNLFQSLNLLVESVIDTLPDKEDRIITQAKKYIEENYNDCITLEDIAAHVYLNKNYFSKFFKDKIGLTYRDYLRNYRIEKAIQLISETDMKIYEIAQSVGYSDSAHFIRAFKTVTGKNPDTYNKGGHFRKSLRK